jgi:hypothetical protein
MSLLYGTDSFILFSFFPHFCLSLLHYCSVYFFYRCAVFSLFFCSYFLYKFYSVLMMVYDTRHYWVFRYSKKLENTTIRKLDLFLPTGRGKTPTLLDPSERASLGHWTTYVRITRAIEMLDPSERASLGHWTTYVRITRAIEIPQSRLCQWKVTGKMYNTNCDITCRDLANKPSL